MMRLLIAIIAAVGFAVILAHFVGAHIVTYAVAGIFGWLVFHRLPR